MTNSNLHTTSVSYFATLLKLEIQRYNKPATSPLSKATIKIQDKVRYEAVSIHINHIFFKVTKVTDCLPQRAISLTHTLFKRNLSMSTL